MKKSFTLVELAVSLAIIAAVTGAGLFSFSRLSPYKMEADSAKIVSDLSWGREVAAFQRIACWIDFDLNNKSYIIYKDGREVQRRFLESNLVSLTDFSGNAVSPIRIIFNYPKGITQDRILNLSLQGRSYQIKIFGQTAYAKTI